MAGKTPPKKSVIAGVTMQVEHADDLSRVIADFDATTHAAQNCFEMANALLDCGKLYDSPNDAVFMAVEGLYEGNLEFSIRFRPQSRVRQQIVEVADATDASADYGVNISAVACHEIAWKYGALVLSVLHKYRTGGIRDGKVFVDTQQLKKKWAAIRDDLINVPRIAPQFEYALEREEKRARQKCDAQLRDANLGKLLETVADNRNRPKPGSGKPRRKLANAAYLVEKAVRAYHKFDGGSVDAMVGPISGRKLSTLADNAFSPRTADRWFVDRFGSKKAYNAACLDGSLGAKLAIKADDCRAFGTFDNSTNVVAAEDLDADESDDAPDKTSGRKRHQVVKKF